MMVRKEPEHAEDGRDAKNDVPKHLVVDEKPSDCRNKPQSEGGQNDP